MSEQEYQKLYARLQSETDPSRRAALKRRMRQILETLFHVDEAAAKFLDPQLYDQWKRAIAGNPKPYNLYDHLTDKEKERMNVADARLPKSKRNNPATNPNLFTEKEIIEERW